MRPLDYSRLHVLVIEDEDYTRQLIVRMLREIGVRTIGERDNGRDGLMELVRTRPDIVLCDIHMTPMNGIHFLQGVRNIKVKGVDRTPVIFLTADSSTEVVRVAGALGVSGYLVKPVSLGKLKERLEIVIRDDTELCARMMGLF
ncbi:response regulator [Nitrospirillum sp. BR 11164]|uniref:response regulator n=1 Tax=Nitrospirillum sp. BR 11164 TaxID=3104324 RepID=UPI002AFEE87E|nr:response regulator [Nitrospirillum sp. BR 11164]MEA1648288.1 response regulator [Nitrospirillum sp. BR 11164]